MSISDKTRKRLWAKSGNLCAISKIELVSDFTSVSDESIIGEECHICTRTPRGPRYNASLSEVELDEYDNLILLSRNHHKIVDDNPIYYTSERLQNIKKSHEEWVRKTLNFEIRNIKSKKYTDFTISFLTRIMTGRQLMNVISGSHAYDFDNDELHSESEVDLVSTFIQNAQELGDLFSDMESGER
ncbi:MAG: HNH endonuclease, partial [Candidatus Aminicenantes bacterium]|nr:HNH endonuclease [Candidatus Aminicenantes bacterium]